MTFFDWVGKIFSEYWLSFLKGTGNTLLMAIVGTLAGFLIGLLVAAVKTVPIRRQNAWFLRPIGFLLSAYIEIVRGTPMLVQALIVNYSLFVRGCTGNRFDTYKDDVLCGIAAGDPEYYAVHRQ